MGFRTRVAACQPSAGEHRFPRAGKSQTLKLRKIVDVGEDSGQKFTDLSNQ
jgi:hypothetical protein